MHSEVVYHRSKNPLHGASVDLSEPKRVKCSRCTVSEQVRFNWQYVFFAY